MSHGNEDIVQRAQDRGRERKESDDAFVRDYGALRVDYRKRHPRSGGVVGSVGDGAVGAWVCVCLPLIALGVAGLLAAGGRWHWGQVALFGLVVLVCSGFQLVLIGVAGTSV